MRSPAVTKALMKLLLATVALLSLSLLCFGDFDQGLRATVGTFVVVVVFPATILLSIDASRTIRREAPSHRPAQMLGLALGFPQAVLGVALLAFGVVYPWFGIREIMRLHAPGAVPIIPMVGIAFALIALPLGYHYVREGVGIDRKRG